MKFARIINRMIGLEWLILPETLNAMVKIASTGSFKDICYSDFHNIKEENYEAIVSQFGQKVEGRKISYRLGNKGIVFIDGPMIPYAIDEASGNISTERIQNELKAFESDPTIEEIIGVFDSPGGAVLGTQETGLLIKKLTKTKRAYVFGMAASAGYWLASSFDEIIAAPDSLSGSIGVRSRVFLDDDKEASIKTIKSTQSPNKTLNKDNLDAEQEIVDEIADVFINTVAENRNTTAKDVMENYGKGWVVTAEKAKERGMIDKIMFFNDFIQFKKPAETTSAGTEEKAMNLDEFLSQNPAAKADFEARINDSYQEGYDSRNEELQRVGKLVQPVLDSKVYPSSIKALAVKVAIGDKSVESLDSATAVWDAHIEESNQQQAVVESNVVDATPATVPEALTGDDPIKENDQMIAELRGDQGLEA